MRLWAIYIFPRSVSLFCRRKYVYRSWGYINRSQTHECWNWGWGRAIPRKGIYKRDSPCSESWHCFRVNKTNGLTIIGIYQTNIIYFSCSSHAWLFVFSIQTCHPGPFVFRSLCLWPLNGKSSFMLTRSLTLLAVDSKKWWGLLQVPGTEGQNVRVSPYITHSSANKNSSKTTFSLCAYCASNVTRRILQKHFAITNVYQNVRCINST